MALREPFAFNIEKITIENKAYRRVVWTGNNIQVVLMSLLPSQVIDMEVHPNIEQFFRVEKGSMKAIISKNLFDQTSFYEYHLKDGDVLLIPLGHYHQITNEGCDELKLYSIYSPPNHPHNRYQEIKPIND
jgi:mannose-6-phosphate isomerase-like protein (cupin superfamily)